MTLENLTTPKIHKQRNTERLVTKSINSHRSNLKFVRSLLTTTGIKATIIRKIYPRFYLKNKRKKERDAILVTMDVKSLHTDIPKHEL